MEDFPEARKFYVERAWLRRIEFRRRQKKFIKELNSLDLNQQSKGKMNLNNDSAEESSEGQSDSDSDQSDYKSEAQKDLTKKKAMIEDVINKNISRFYFNMNIDQELNEDFATDELEDYSSDEIEPNVEDILKKDNKKVSFQNAKSINEQYIKMSETFNKMTESSEKNMN